MLAYYAPPAVGIAAQRIAGMVRHLPAFGWDPVVVVPQSVHYHRDASGALEGATVVPAPNPEPSRWLRRLWGGARGGAGAGAVQTLDPAPTGATGGFLRRLARDWLYVPDARFLWIRPAGEAAARAVQDATGPVVLYSTSVPFSAHFAALRAARHTGAPWVAEYRDPWSVAPPQLGSRPAIREVIDRRLDHTIVTTAQRVVVTSEATRELFLQAFSELAPSAIDVVRNGWEGRHDDRAPQPEAPMTLVYSGSLLKSAWAEPLLLALEQIHARAPGSVVLEVLGPEAPWEAALGVVKGDASFVRLRGMVPREAMPARLVRASVLVVLQPRASLQQYVPGKAYEYLGARRPVLALIPEDGEVAGLLARHGDVRRVAAGTPGAFRAQLETLLDEHRGGLLQGARVEWEAVETLSRMTQAGKLADILAAAAGLS
jgi:hypothetical protein